MPTPLKKSNRTFASQAPNNHFDSRTFTSPANGRIYLVSRHKRPTEKSYSYHVLEGIDSHNYREVETEASSRCFLGVPPSAEGNEVEWWGIWPEPRF